MDSSTKEELAARWPEGEFWPLGREGLKWIYFPSGISYVYRGGDMAKKAVPDMIVAYDKTGYHFNELRNVLYADLQVLRIDEQDLAEAIEEDNSLRREQGMVEIPME